MDGLIYDTGALIAAERDSLTFWRIHKNALARGVLPTVPAPVLVEAWRGGAAMARLLNRCAIVPLDTSRAKSAGMLLGRCSLAVEATDAVVVELALRTQSVVVSGNRAHLEALAAGVSRRLAVIDL